MSRRKKKNVLVSTKRLPPSKRFFHETVSKVMVFLAWASLDTGKSGSEFVLGGMYIVCCTPVRYIPVYFFMVTFISSSTRNRFNYLQRASGQAVVTGSSPSSPWYVPPFLSRIRFSILTVRRNSPTRALFLSLCKLCQIYNMHTSHGWKHVRDTHQQNTFFFFVRMYPWYLFNGCVRGVDLIPPRKQTSPTTIVELIDWAFDHLRSLRVLSRETPLQNTIYVTKEHDAMEVLARVLYQSNVQ